jgi:hypothetical protein
MANQKSNMKNAGAGSNQKKAEAGLSVRTAVKAGKVTFQDILVTSY